jgi:hypothetical protein
MCYNNVLIEKADCDAHHSLLYIFYGKIGLDETSLQETLSLH